jgi:hypothetical protein
MSQATLDQEPYGFELALAVASALEQGHRIMHCHKEYCGMALEFRDGRFVYGEVYDGAFDFSPPPEQTGAVFPTRVDFVSWLAAQSDEALSGRERNDDWYFNNARITRRRLEEAVHDARTRARG